MADHPHISSMLVVALAVLGCVPKPAAAPVPTHDSGLAAAPEPTAPVSPEPDTEVSLTPLTDGVWLHTSTRVLEGYGPVPSHGLVVEHPKGALLIDTAWGAAATRELLVQIERQLGPRPRAAIITDFHEDRAGGASVLEAAGIEVWTSQGIARRLEPHSLAKSATTFETPHFAGRIAGIEVEVRFPGPGHSPEGLVVWLPQLQLLFGGCFVRPLESRDLGNAADADLLQWGPSLRVVREHYGRARIVVPSHGAPGDRRMLDHTLALVDIAVTAAAIESGGPRPPTKVAITVDDLPRHGPLPKGTTRAQIHATLLDAFARHHVPEVQGFVIGKHAKTSADHREALRLWTDAGHPLGNHTWSHPNMEEIGVEAFLADIDANEAVLAELTGDASGASWRSFRYPYLRQGFDEDSSQRVRAHLAKGGYQVAEVSIDFWDWDYQAPYARCLEARSSEGVEALRRTYLARAGEMLEWHRAAALAAFDRPIAHVLVLHAGAFTGLMIDELLGSYEARGVQWVPLDEALADPIYRDVPLPSRTHGDVIVEQAITTLHAEHPPWSSHPGALLHVLCK